MIKKFFVPLFGAEKRVREYGREDRWQQVSVIIWLTIAAFAVMGVVDLLQRSYFPPGHHDCLGTDAVRRSAGR